MAAVGEPITRDGSDVKRWATLRFIAVPIGVRCKRVMGLLPRIYYKLDERHLQVIMASPEDDRFADKPIVVSYDEDVLVALDDIPALEALKAGG